MKCAICHKELIPDEDDVLQLRIGHLATGEDEDFVARQDVDYFHSGCFGGIEFPTEQEAKELEACLDRGCPECGAKISAGTTHVCGIVPKVIRKEE